MIEDAWFDPIWRLHNEHFDDAWPARVRDFNKHIGYASEAKFFTPHSELPPPWFNGDVQALMAGQWVLIVSINPHIDPADGSLSKRQFTSESWWDYWRCFNLGDNWKREFFPRLVRLARDCLPDLALHWRSSCPEEMPEPSETKVFATTSMLFVEFCPYASASLPDRSWERWKEITASDLGFGIAREVRNILFNYGEPALVLCNGKFSSFDVKDNLCGEMDLVSASLPERPEQKECLLYQEFVPAVGRPFPVVGFNQVSNRRPWLHKIIRSFVTKEELHIERGCVTWSGRK